MEDQTTEKTVARVDEARRRRGTTTCNSGRRKEEGGMRASEMHA
jgi:hypothetical protein